MRAQEQKFLLLFFKKEDFLSFLHRFAAVKQTC